LIFSGKEEKATDAGAFFGRFHERLGTTLEMKLIKACGARRCLASDHLNGYYFRHIQGNLS
jgi:hypothetical protein